MKKLPIHMKTPSEHRRETVKAIIVQGILANPSFSSELCGLGELAATEAEKQIIEEQMKWLSRAVERVYSIIQDHYQEDA